MLQLWSSTFPDCLQIAAATTRGTSGIPTLLGIHLQHPVQQQAIQVVSLSLVAPLDPTAVVFAPERAVHSMLNCVPGSAADELRNDRAKFPDIHRLGVGLFRARLLRNSFAIQLGRQKERSPNDGIELFSLLGHAQVCQLNLDLVGVSRLDKNIIIGDVAVDDPRFKFVEVIDCRRNLSQDMTTFDPRKVLVFLEMVPNRASGHVLESQRRQWPIVEAEQFHYMRLSKVSLEKAKGVGRG